ncbi:MAG: hypothetical protein ACFFC7_12470 [Candidatus Hermodarchaeota archaeon]
MPPSLVWFFGLINLITLTLIIVGTNLFFLKRVRDLGQWQDGYLTLTYLILGISIIPLYANLLLIPLLGNSLSSQTFLTILWRGYLVSNLLYLLPLAMFTKITFRPNSRIATVLILVIMLSAAIGLIETLFQLSYTLTWDSATWLMLYNYNNLHEVVFSFIHYALTVFWFSGESFRLYVQEKRKIFPNPIQIRRFLFLFLSGASLLLSTVFIMISLDIYTTPQDANAFLYFFLYFSPILLTGTFVLFSAIGWITPQWRFERFKTLWIISEGGIPLYHANFMYSEFEKISHILISGLIAAIFSSAQIYSADEIQCLQMSNGELYYSKNKYGQIIVAETKSKMKTENVCELLTQIGEIYHEKFPEVHLGLDLEDPRFLEFEQDISSLLKQKTIIPRTLRGQEIEIILQSALTGQKSIEEAARTVEEIFTTGLSQNDKKIIKEQFSNLLELVNSLNMDPSIIKRLEQLKEKLIEWPEYFDTLWK